MMLSITVKATIVMMLALAGTAVARRSRASVRHLILAATFMILLVLPFAIQLAPPIELQVPRLPNGMLGHQLESAAATTEANVEVTTNASPASSSIPLSAIAGGLWAAGSILLSLPIAAGLWQFRRIRRSGSAWARGAEIADETVDVILHESVTGPMTFGLIRPAIILPCGAKNWNEAELRRALVHELEHVRRRDSVMHLLARFVCSVYWFHPLIWFSWRRLRLEAERACDDAVLRHAEATEYADQLVAIAQHTMPTMRTPVLAMASRSDLKMRVAAVLDGTQRRGRAGAICLATTIAIVVLLIGVISPLRAVQSQPQEFEVASIKKNTSGHGPYNLGSTFEPGGRFHVTNAPLSTLIRIAYDLNYKQLDDNGFSLVMQPFDVDARAPENSVSRDAQARTLQLRPMMQKLLADRFKLTIHKQTKEMPLYALVVAKNGPRLKPAVRDPKCAEPEDCPSIAGPARGFQGRNIGLAHIALMLTAFVDRPVIDRTGIEGRFDVDLPPWSRSPLQGPTGGERDGTETAPDPLNPSIFDVIQDRLGLKLEAVRGPYDVYVVDHVEQPTEN